MVSLQKCLQCSDPPESHLQGEPTLAKNPTAYWVLNSWINKVKSLTLWYPNPVKGQPPWHLSMRFCNIFFKLHELLLLSTVSKAMSKMHTIFPFMSPLPSFLSSSFCIAWANPSTSKIWICRDQCKEKSARIISSVYFLLHPSKFSEALVKLPGSQMLL